MNMALDLSYATLGSYRTSQRDITHTSSRPCNTDVLYMNLWLNIRVKAVFVVCENKQTEYMYALTSTHSAKFTNLFISRICLKL